MRDGSTLAYDALLLAIGARARVISGLEECSTLRTAEDAERLVPSFAEGKSVGIVGGGFIGLELAATARGAGADVAVIEAGPRLMARAVPEAVAAHVRSRHERDGVDVRTGVAVTSANAHEIVLGDGTRLAFDLVVAGVGATPNTRLAEGRSQAPVEERLSGGVLAASCARHANARAAGAAIDRGENL